MFVRNHAAALGVVGGGAALALYVLARKKRPRPRAVRPRRADGAEAAAGDLLFDLIYRVAARARAARLLGGLLEDAPWVSTTGLLRHLLVPPWSTTFLSTCWALLRASAAGCAYALSLGLNLGGVEHAVSLHAHYAGVFGRMIVRSLMRSPAAEVRVDMLSPNAHGRPCWKHIFAVRLGNFDAVCRHTLRVSLKNAPRSGWDDLVRRDHSRVQRRLDMDGSPPSSMAPPATRHTRVASGLSWRCDLCGERAQFSEEECPYCCNPRPSLDKIPQKGDQETIGPMIGSPSRPAMSPPSAVLSSPRDAVSQNPDFTTTPPSRRRVSNLVAASARRLAAAMDPDDNGRPEQPDPWTVCEFHIQSPAAISPLEAGTLFGSIQTIFEALEPLTGGFVDHFEATPTNAPPGLHVRFAIHADLFKLTMEEYVKPFAPSLVDVHVETWIQSLAASIVFSGESVSAAMQHNREAIFSALYATDRVFGAIDVEVTTTDTELGGRSLSALAQETRVVRSLKVALVSLLGAVGSVWFAERVSDCARWPWVPEFVISLHELVDNVESEGLKAATWRPMVELLRKQHDKIRPLIEKVDSFSLSCPSGEFQCSVGTEKE
jgi:hypothetical protein